MAGTLVLCSTLLVAACATTKSGSKADAETLGGPLVSPYWSASDSEFVASRLATALASSPELARLRAKLGHAPRVRFAHVRNRTNQHIRGRAITQLLELHLRKAGLNTVPETAAAQADLVFLSLIASREHRHGRREVHAMIFRLDAVDARTGGKLWLGVEWVRKLLLYPPRSKTSAGQRLWPKAVRLPADKVLHLSDALDDQDARAIAEEAAASATKGWLSTAARPLVAFRAASAGMAFGNTLLEAALRRSGQLRMVAERGEQYDLRVANAPPPGLLSPEITIRGEWVSKKSGAETQHTVSIKAVRVRDQQTVWSFKKRLTKKVPPPASPVK